MDFVFPRGISQRASVKRISIEILRKQAANRPAGYLEEIMAAGNVSGGVLSIEDQAYAQFVAKYTPLPSFKTRLKTFIGALIRWIKSGFRISPLLYLKRRPICQSCEFWRQKDVYGLGRCGMCGCTKLKLFLPKERCPKHPPRW